ncbi:hypothetical protein [Sinomonas atrocyanea]
MDDVEQLELEVLSGAQRRNLRIVEALITGETKVQMLHEKVTVEDALDIAQLVFAPFITVTLTRLEASDFGEEPGPWDDDEDEDDEDSPLADELLKPWAARIGQADGLFVQWAAGGVVYTWMAVPDWKQELGQRLAEWREERDARRLDERRGLQARIAHLASRLEREPRFRGAGRNERNTIGKTILEPWLRSEEAGIDIVVLPAASRLVRENATAAYLPLLDRLDALVEELHRSEGWLSGRTLADRKAAVRAFLVEKSGGYAPTGEQLEEVFRAAEAPRRGR